MTTPQVLNDRYVLDERLATGGMGEVWKATDRLLGRPVAVKLLKQQYLSDEQFRGRFRAEARFAAALQHSGIAQVYDYGEQDDLAYLVMELVRGQTLSRILHREGGLPADHVLDLVYQAARALQVAHTAGIIHRDIKPANLMVTSDGTVKITDFGIARGGAGSTTMTQTGMVMGTAQYVAPEQASGRRVTPAADLYSLGVVAYECLAGRPPFVADTPVALALMHVREEPPPLPATVPPAIGGLVGAMLAKDPSDRPQGAHVVADGAYAIRQALLGDASTTETAVAEGWALENPADGAWAAADDGTAAGDGAGWDDAAGSYPGDSTVGHPVAGPGRATTAHAGALPAAPGARRRQLGMLALAATAIVIFVGAGVFMVGTLWNRPDHTKLVDGNRIQPAGGVAPSTHSQRPPVGEPTDRPVPSGAVSSPTTYRPAPGPTMSPTPTPTPTRTRKPPKTTPTATVPEEPSPTSSEEPPPPTGSPTP